RKFCRRLARDPELALDISQETFTRALTYRDSFSAGTNFKGWLFTIAQNLYFSNLRRSRREDRLPPHHETPDPLTPERIFAAKQELTFLTKISEEKRVAVELRANGVSLEEIAVRCGTEVGTIKSRICRGRGELKVVINTRPV